MNRYVVVYIKLARKKLKEITYISSKHDIAKLTTYENMINIEQDFFKYLNMRKTLARENNLIKHK